MKQAIAVARAVLAALLLALALPASAAVDNKFFYAEFPGDLADIDLKTAGTQISVKVVNDSSPPGFSTINSLRIKPPAGVTITAATVNGVLVGVSTLTNPANGYLINGFPGIRRGETTYFVLTITSTISGCSNATWQISANTGNSESGGDDFQPRTQLMKLTSWPGCTQGHLKCPSIPTAPGITSYSEPPANNTTSLMRWENKDLSPCIPVTFDVNITNGGKQVEVVWDMSVQPYATIDVDVQWPLELIDPTTTSPHRTKVNWSIPLDASKTIPAPACLSNLPPTQYGTLVAAIDGAQTSNIQINATSLPAVPFPIVIGSSVAGTDPERILVKAVSGTVPGVVTVTDAVRGSGGSTASAHSLGAAVASTPLPVIDQNAKLPVGSTTAHPYAGQQAMACVYEERFEVQPFGTTGCPAQATGVEPLSCVSVRSWLFFIGDPIVSRGI